MDTWTFPLYWGNMVRFCNSFIDKKIPKPRPMFKLVIIHILDLLIYNHWLLVFVLLMEWRLRIKYIFVTKTVFKRKDAFRWSEAVIIDLFHIYDSADHFYNPFINTPRTRGWSRLRDRTLAGKRRKNAQKSVFFSQKINNQPREFPEVGEKQKAYFSFFK